VVVEEEEEEEEGGREEEEDRKRTKCVQTNEWGTREVRYLGLRSTRGAAVRYIDIKMKGGTGVIVHLA
jgi:hypothetical protein